MAADDEFQFGIPLPFAANLYSTTDRSLTITTNGLLTLGDNTSISESFVDNNGDAPASLYSDSVAAATVFGWWKYMYTNGGGSDGIWWQVNGAGPSQSVSVEWMMWDESGRLSWFTVGYSAARPGRWGLWFWSDGDRGNDSTVGIQGLGAQQRECLSFF